MNVHSLLAQNGNAPGGQVHMICASRAQEEHCRFWIAVSNDYRTRTNGKPSDTIDIHKTQSLDDSYPGRMG